MPVFYRHREKIEVLEPMHVREEMKKVLETMIDKYK
jgi:predicted DNA-binding transcriptional regulator YafY